MKNKTLLNLILLIFGMIGLSTAQSEDPIWQERVAPLVQGCSTSYDKAKAIFDWVAHHIAYDVTMKINTAEEGWTKKKGICQAYTEIYVSLAKACGLNAEIINGESKGAASPDGDGKHAWVKIETEKGWILADPTWGAGSVDQNRFTFSYKSYWFDVDPWWMFFTHYPEKPGNQLLPQPLARVMYDKLPEMAPSMSWWGWNSEKTLQYYWSNQNQKPPFMFTLKDEWIQNLQVDEVPFFGELKANYKYLFKMKSLNDNYVFGIGGTANKNFFGEFSSGMDIVPTSSGTLIISIVDKQTNQVHDLLEYKVTK